MNLNSNRPQPDPKGPGGCPPTGRTNLNERARNILKALIREYVQTGKPVGSRRLAKLDPERLSPATIRNVVADLEEMGYVAQPHTSAGRIPTASGYRVYVDSLLDGGRLPSEQELREIEASLEREPDLGELMSKTSQVLSALTNSLGFVLAPSFSATVIKRVEFVRIAKRRILVILVAQTGLVQHRMIHLDNNLSQSDLDQAGRYLTTHFAGKTLTEARDELLVLMSEERALYDHLLKNVILLASVGLMTQDDQAGADSEVYFGGTAGIIRKPEMADVNRMLVLFREFEEKSRLVRIITECLKDDVSRPLVVIGLEDSIPELRDWAIISSPYLRDQQIVGNLGVIGPSRMEYENAITLVDYVAKLFGRLISHQ